jgi:cell division septation protein DedD
VDLRNLDQIREQEDAGSGRGLGPWLLGAGGVGALLVALVMSMPEKHVAAESTEDPLAELIAKAKEQPSAPADQLSPEHVSFAQILTDKERPSTALVAVKTSDGRMIDSSDPQLLDPHPQLPEAPPPGDQLPVVPLPAGKLLDATKLTVEPQDDLTGLAAARAQLSPSGERAEAGSSGEYQIQVASFRDKSEADAYVQELRLRGHRAHNEAARIPNRGLWYRVRIGPFKDKLKALSYKADFERKEGMTAMLVDPERAERREAERAAEQMRVKALP